MIMMSAVQKTQQKSKQMKNYTANVKTGERIKEEAQ